MSKILFIAAHRPDRSPAQRFRFEQYFDFLKENGFKCDFSYLISEKDDRKFYSHGSYFTKFKVLINSGFKRFKDISRADDYDIIFVQREAFMTGSTYFERKFSQSKAKLVFDFDDSLWLPNVSEGNRIWEWLKDYRKTAKIITLADMVIAGNQYLADYALNFNSNVKIIPTTIDTNKYVKSAKPENEKICIGWSGSITTTQHFGYAIAFLKKIKEKYGDKIFIKVIGDDKYCNEELGVQAIAWNKKNEIKELSSFDIGIMPLPDDEWAKGKCGLKGLQYMALEVPTIMSPIGVNTEIIKNGVNGFLANDVEEWVDRISLLIESKELREKIGKAARNTVIEKYSVESQKKLYLKYLKEVLE